MEEARLSRSAMIAITVLRVIVGWHILYEGIAKLTSSSWSAAGYMRASRGPFAEFFRWIASQPQLLDKANLITMYGLTIVGALLMLGLFTRLAAIAGIGFILLFYLCNPPFVFLTMKTDMYVVMRQLLWNKSGLLRHSRLFCTICKQHAGVLLPIEKVASKQQYLRQFRRQKK